MKKTILSLLTISLVCALGLTAADELPEGRAVKVSIQDKTFKGELLSATPELIVVRLFDKDKEKGKRIIVGFPTADTELVSIVKNCGPIGNLFTKGRKFAFKNAPETIPERIAELSRYALYGSRIPDFLKDQIEPVAKP